MSYEPKYVSGDYEKGLVKKQPTAETKKPFTPLKSARSRTVPFSDTKPLQNEQLMGIIGIVLAIWFPIGGLIYAIIMLNKKDLKEKKLFRIGLIISIILNAIGFLIFFGGFFISGL